MAVKKRTGARIGIAAFVVALCLVACACAVHLGSSFANAKDGDSETFGLGSQVSSTTTTVGTLEGMSSTQGAQVDVEQGASGESNTQVNSTDTVSDTQAMQDISIQEESTLATSSSRDISENVTAIETRKEEERLAAEKAAKEAEEKAIQAAALAKAQADLSLLPDVDFTVGKEAFIEEWGARIDAYLEGSPLAGYGDVFAEAAFDNGVDPRFSPAISNTESSKGAACFRAYNAWGWFGELGDSWEESIKAHVAGLAAGYGYTISEEAAKAYCPPTWEDWFEKTLAQMQLI